MSHRGGHAGCRLLGAGLTGLVLTGCAAPVVTPVTARVAQYALVAKGLEVVPQGEDGIVVLGRVQFGQGCPPSQGSQAPAEVRPAGEVELCGNLLPGSGRIRASWASHAGADLAWSDIATGGAFRLTIGRIETICNAINTLRWTVTGREVVDGATLTSAIAATCQERQAARPQGVELAQDQGRARLVESGRQVGEATVRDGPGGKHKAVAGPPASDEDEDEATDDEEDQDSGRNQGLAERAAWDAVRRTLKNPASGQLMGSKVVATQGSLDYLVVMDVVAQNSFGGSTRSMCSAAVRVMPNQPGRYQQCLLGNIANPTECFASGGDVERALNLMVALFQRKFCD